MWLFFLVAAAGFALFGLGLLPGPDVECIRAPCPSDPEGQPAAFGVSGVLAAIGLVLLIRSGSFSEPKD